MKFNRPFFIKAVLTAFLITLTSLSVNAKDYEAKNYVEVGEVIAAKPAEQDYSAKNSDESFVAKHTTGIEFTFAILVVVIGLAVSEKLQKNKELQPFTKDEGYES